MANCNDDREVDVPEGTQLEVFNGLFAAPAQGVITRDCTVTLEGEDSELNLAEGTDLLFATCAALCAGICDAACIAGNVGDYKSFTIETDIAGDAGFEIEIQVKKNSIIEAEDVNFTITGAEEAEAQFEENFCLRAHGSLNLSMSLTSDEGGDVQFKKFDLASAVAARPAGFRAQVFTDAECGASPNIKVNGDILLSVGDPTPGVVQGDAEIQIEENNYLV